MSMRAYNTVLAVAVVLALAGPRVGTAQEQNRFALLFPDAVWDGTPDAPQQGVAVLIKGTRIEAVGRADAIKTPPGADRVDLPGTTLIPGLIEGHSHLFL